MSEEERRNRVRIYARIHGVQPDQERYRYCSEPLVYDGPLATGFGVSERDMLGSGWGIGSGPEGESPRKGLEG